MRGLFAFPTRRPGLIMPYRWRKTIGIALFFCAAILIFVRWHGFILSGISEKIEIVKYLAQRLGLWAPLVYFIGFILRPILFFPSTPYAILAGVLFGSFWGALYVAIGAMCSAICEFLLVRHLAGGKIKMFLEKKTRGISRVVARHGFATVFFVRVIPNIAFDLQNCGLALAPIKFTHYVFGTLLGCLPAFVFYSSLGSLKLNFPFHWQAGFIVFLGACLYILKIILSRTDVYRSNDREAKQ